MSNSIARQGVSFGLNQMAPGLVSLGPLTLGLGTLVGLAMAVMGLFGSDSPPIPESVIVNSKDGSITDDVTGKPVVTGDFGAFQQWVLSVASNYAKLLAFFTNGVPDYSTFGIHLRFEQWSYGTHGQTYYTTTDYGTGVTSSVLGPVVMQPRWYIHVETGNNSVSYDAQDNFDSTRLFWKIMKSMLLTSGNDLDASIVTIMNSVDDPETAIDLAVAQRKKDLALAKQNMVDLQRAIADLKKQHATLAALQDADLYQQQADFLQQQMDMANSQLDTLANATATSDSVAGAKTPTIAPAIPVLLLLSLLT